MSRSKTSQRWLDEHVNDIYVKQAKKEGYRTRACYKLLEINDRDRLFKPGITVIDLGAAPGGWSQVATELLDGKGTIIASDILPMDALANVQFIQGDFTEDEVFENIMAAIDNSPVDLVMSDMAPNMSGMKDIDQPRSMYLVELAVDLAKQVLVKDGNFLTKVFQGEGFQELQNDLRQHFKQVVIRKPAASRARSSEVYIVAKGFKG